MIYQDRVIHLLLNMDSEETVWINSVMTDFPINSRNTIANQDNNILRETPTSVLTTTNLFGGPPQQPVSRFLHDTTPPVVKRFAYKVMFLVSPGTSCSALFLWEHDNGSNAFFESKHANPDRTDNTQRTWSSWGRRILFGFLNKYISNNLPRRSCHIVVYTSTLWSKPKESASYSCIYQLYGIHAGYRLRQC